MQYFTIQELYRSQTAAARGIDNTPSLYALQNLTALVDNVLDPLRATWHRPITVTSGYRCPQLNRIVGGSATSQHTKGEAADITATPSTPQDNYQLGRLIAQLGDFDQLIFEDTGRNDLLPLWIHVSYKRLGFNRREIRKHVKGTGPIYPFVNKHQLGL